MARAAVMSTLELAGGTPIPAMGFGAGTAWFGATGDKAEALKQSLTSALDVGFRHVDCAEMYKNDAPVGEAVCAWLAKAGVPRSELFVTNKVSSCDEPGVDATCRASLAATGLQYFDLYLIHAPVGRGGPFKQTLLEIWRAMEALVDEGLVRAIGVSNWRVGDLEQVFEEARVKPVCNQVECHPYFQQTDLFEWCAARAVLVTAYGSLIPLKPRGEGSPEGRGLAGGAAEPAIMAAAERAQRTPAQVLLRWALQTGRGLITTTGKADRLQEYLGVFDFELSAAEVASISEAGASESPQRVFWANL